MVHGANNPSNDVNQNPHFEACYSMIDKVQKVKRHPATANLSIIMYTVKSTLNSMLLRGIQIQTFPIYIPTYLPMGIIFGERGLSYTRNTPLIQF